jgi:hypothetical protein
MISQYYTRMISHCHDFDTNVSDEVDQSESEVSIAVLGVNPSVIRYPFLQYQVSRVIPVGIVLL